MAWFEPLPHRPERRPGSACARRRRPASSAASTRTASTRRSPASSSCSARPAPTSSSTPAPSTPAATSLPPAERSCAVRISAGQPDPRHVARRRRPAAAARPDRLHRVAATATCATVALPSWRPDSTEEIDVIEEVARHYGYDRIGKTVPTSTLHGRLSVAPAAPPPAARGAARPRASPRRCRTRSSRPTRWRGPGSTATRCAITNPLVAEESVLRTSLRPGLLRAVAFNESHRRTGVALFEIGHVYPPGPGELPDEYEALGVVLAGEEAPAAVAVWREIAAAMGIGARIDQGRVPPGLHPTRSATLVAGRDADRRRRRGRPRRARRRSASPSGSPSLELDLRPRARPRAQAGAVEADEPAPVERPRPGLRAARRRAGREARQGDPPGRRRAARRPRAVRRVPRRRRGRRPAQPRLPAAPAGARPQPHRRRRRRRPARRSPRRRPSSGPSCAG